MKTKMKLGYVFYFFAVLFTIITIYLSVDGFIGLAASASEYGVTMSKEWAVVLKSLLATSGGFLGFSIMFWGLGIIINRLSR